MAFSPRNHAALLPLVKQCRPVVEAGVECLLETRNASELQSPFAPAILRYIDAFGSKFTERRSVASFV